MFYITRAKKIYRYEKFASSERSLHTRVNNFKCGMTNVCLKNEYLIIENFLYHFQARDCDTNLLNDVINSFLDLNAHKNYLDFPFVSMGEESEGSKY